MAPVFDVLDPGILPAIARSGADALAAVRRATHSATREFDATAEPALDTGKMLSKQLAYVSHAEGAGLVLGATVPVFLRSRFDGPMSRLGSCTFAAIHHVAGAMR